MFLRYSAEEHQSFIIALQPFERYSERHLNDQSLEGEVGLSPDTSRRGKRVVLWYYFPPPVFIPGSLPTIRPLPVFEVSQDLVGLLA